MRLSFECAGCFLLIASAAMAQESPTRVYLESVPSTIQSRMEKAERHIQEQRQQAGLQKVEGVVDALRLWLAGSTVTVAFNGGSDALCLKIADVASRWTEHGNLRFSFHGNDGQLRRWSPADGTYAAQIRVGFNHPDGGYFSLVGTQSNDPELVLPHEASMNLDSFDRVLPREWESVVLHEFGHAIGFLHEHQSPVVDCGFQMEDEEGYIKTTNPQGEFIPDKEGKKPGVYSQLGGPPNGWSRAQVDFNIQKLKRSSSMFIASAFDRKSIMKYDLPEWMFMDGADSDCFTGRWNARLSDLDKSTMASAYPKSSQAIEHLRKSIEEYKANSGQQVEVNPARVEVDNSWKTLHSRILEAQALIRKKQEETSVLLSTLRM